MLVGAAISRGQNPFTIRCDTIDASRYPLLGMRIGVDSLANPILDLTNDDLTITGGFLQTPLGTQVIPGSCRNDSLSVLLVIDESGSMSYVLNGSTTRLQGAVAAATSFLNRLAIPPGEAGLLSFSANLTFPPWAVRQSPRYLQAFTRNRGQVLNALGQLTANGGTDIDGAVRTALSLLKDRKGRRVLVLLTDGHEQPDYGFSSDLSSFIAQAVAESVFVFTIGLYPSNDQDRQIGEPLLTAFANGTRGAYFRAPSVAELMSAYDSIYYRLLRPSCAITMAVPAGYPFCDSGRVDVTITFHRHGDTVSCQTFYIAPYIPPSCDCRPVVFSGVSTLSAPYPNPAGGGTTASVSFSTVRDGPVSVSLVSAMGAVVATPVGGTLRKGAHTASVWLDGLAPGLYFWEMNVGGAILRRPLVVVR